MNIRELIESAYEGVRIVVCLPCKGLGEIGLPTLRATCPHCGGCGETTNGANLGAETAA